MGTRYYSEDTATPGSDAAKDGADAAKPKGEAEELKLKLKAKEDEVTDLTVSGSALLPPIDIYISHRADYAISKPTS